MRLKNQNIIIISNEKWGEVWYSKHHWANELSLNNNICFLNPPPKWTLKHLLKGNINSDNFSESLQIVNYNNRLPFTRFKLIFRLNEFLITQSLKKWFKKNDFTNYLFWSFDPFRFSTPSLLNPKLSLFYITDLFSNREEKKIIKNVDYVLAVNKTLLDKFSNYNKNMFVIPHGISKSQEPSEKLVNQIILIGTFTDRINLELLQKIASNFPETILALYGPKLFKNKSNSTKFEELITNGNVNYLGYGSIKNIEHELKQSKIAIAVYLKNNLGARLNSLKIIQYLSFGKNIVTSFFEDYENIYKEGLLEMADDEEDFIKKCSVLLKKEEDLILNKKRIKYAEQYLYSNLIKSIEKLLD